MDKQCILFSVMSFVADDFKRVVGISFKSRVLQKSLLAFLHLHLCLQRCGAGHRDAGARLSLDKRRVRGGVSWWESTEADRPWRHHLLTQPKGGRTDPAALLVRTKVTTIMWVHVVGFLRAGSDEVCYISYYNIILFSNTVVRFSCHINIPPHFTLEIQLFYRFVDPMRGN